MLDAVPTPRADAVRSGWRLRATRAGFVLGALAAWFWTQSLLGARAFPPGTIGDGLLDATAPVHRWLTSHPSAADGLLIVSSLGIDALGLFLLGRAIFGPSVRPLLALLAVFGLRQICQFTCALPPPDGMIWRDPGFPSLLVTYGVSTDFFFSGHTALAVLGCVELARLRRPGWVVCAVLLAGFEIAAVLALRAHYAMDVFAALFVALFVSSRLDTASEWCDRWLAGAAPVPMRPR